MSRKVRRAKPPRAFVEFSRRFPAVAKAWDLLGEAGSTGPLDGKTTRLVKLGISIAARSEGATHSATRKAQAAGASAEEIFQVVALAASTVGLPNAVAAYTWIQDELEDR
jgi:alkylhydroperoxidase/carboxymuconolactone decarboxylase family protein YurZ